MPDKEFLETYPLYRKFTTEFPNRVDRINKPAIHMSCEVCQSLQTFNMVNTYYENLEYSNVPPENLLVRALYTCSSCSQYQRAFLLKIGPDAKSVYKAGQFPAWEIEIDDEMKEILGDFSKYYMKGLICESQGYGIASFAYYRRIVEEIIDQLLSDIADLLGGEEKEQYLEALERVKKSKVTQDKIEIVKDLIPPILRPGGMNPLSVLHTTLSEGLHQKSDEECLDLAMNLREILLFLVHQISTSKRSSDRFTDSMRKILENRSESPDKSA